MNEPLAVNGGTPVRDELLPYGSQSITGADAEAVKQAVLDDWITQGPRIDEFEEAFAGYCGADHAVAVSSGTAALHAAVHAAGIGEGDEAITSPLTFAATANAVVFEGGAPVFADVDLETLTIDPDRIKEQISESTEVLLPVDFAGHPAGYERINDIAEKHDLTVIADACHAPGAEYRGRKTGTLADMTVFSFHPVKHITTGEGGMIVTDDREYAERLQRFRHHGITKDPERLTRPDEGPWYYEIHEPGRNYRITDIQCALGLQQLDRLDECVRKRRRIAQTYDERIGDMDGVLPPPESDDVKHAYHIYPVQYQPDAFTVDRKTIFNALRAENIGVQVHYVPVHYHPYYRRTYEYEPGEFPEAVSYYDRCITLPLFPDMTEQDVDDVLIALQKIHRAYSV